MTGSKTSKLNVASKATSKTVSSRIFTKNENQPEENQLTVQIELNDDLSKNADSNNKIIKALAGDHHFRRQIEKFADNRKCMDARRILNKKSSSTNMKNTKTEVSSKRISGSLIPIPVNRKSAANPKFFSTNEAKFLKTINKDLYKSKKNAVPTKSDFKRSKYKTEKNIDQMKMLNIMPEEISNNDVVPEYIKMFTASENVKYNKLPFTKKNDMIPFHSRNNYSFPEMKFVDFYEQNNNFEISSGKARERDMHKHVRVQCYEKFHIEVHSREVKEMKSEIIPVISDKKYRDYLIQRYHQKYKDEFDDKQKNDIKKYLATDHGVRKIHSEELNLDKFLSIEETCYHMQQKNTDDIKLNKSCADADYPIIKNDFSKCLSQDNPADENNCLKKKDDKPILNDCVIQSEHLNISRLYGIIHNSELENISSNKVPIPETEKSALDDTILEKKIQSEEFLNLVREICSDLEPETNVTYDKTDFPFHSNGKSEDSATKIFDNIIKKDDTIPKNETEDEKVSDTKTRSEKMNDKNLENKKVESKAKVDEKIPEKKTFQNIKNINHITKNLTHDKKKEIVKSTVLKRPVQCLKEQSENWKSEKINSDSKVRNITEESKMKKASKQILKKKTNEESRRKYLTLYRGEAQEQTHKSFQKFEQKDITKDAKLKNEFVDFKQAETVREDKSKQAGEDMGVAHDRLKIQKSNTISKTMAITEKRKMKKDFKCSEGHIEEFKPQKVKENHEREKSNEKLNSAQEEMNVEKGNTGCVPEKRFFSEVTPEKHFEEKTSKADTIENIKPKEVKQEKKITEIATSSETSLIKKAFKDAVDSDETKDAALEITDSKHAETHMPAFAKSSLEQFDAKFLSAYDKMCFTGKAEEGKFINFEIDQLILHQPHENQMLLYDIANCTATQAYLMMCNFKFDIEYKKNSEQMSPSGKVPFISSGICIVSEFESIVSFMQYKKFSCVSIADYDKPAFRKLLSMVMGTLEMAERYICWLNEETLVNYTMPKIGMHHPFPLNYILNWKKKYEERKLLCEQGVQGKSLDIILKEINSCFRNLSHSLGKNDFFFKTTTELDALVYGHVYALLSAKQEGPIREVQSILFQYPNLISFAVNFDKSFSLSKLSNVNIPCLEYKSESLTNLH